MIIEIYIEKMERKAESLNEMLKMPYTKRAYSRICNKFFEIGDIIDLIYSTYPEIENSICCFRYLEILQNTFDVMDGAVLWVTHYVLLQLNELNEYLC